MSSAAVSILLAASIFQAVPGPGYRVIDGDTFQAGSETIRISNIDAPETDGACMNERMLASLAKARLESLLQEGGVEIERSKKDRYGRTLATVRAGGSDVGHALVREGLAREWMNNYRPGLERWCGQSEIELNHDMAISLFCASHGFENEFKAFLESAATSYGRDAYPREQAVRDLLDFGITYTADLDLTKDAGDNPGLGMYFCKTHVPR